MGGEDEEASKGEMTLAEWHADKIEWWKLSDMGRNYGAMGIGGMLALTSLLASLGIMQGLNLMAWGFGGMLATLLQVGIFSMRYLGYVSYHKDSRSSTATLAAGGATMVEKLRMDWIRDELALIISVMAVVGSLDAVMLGSWMSMSAEAQNDKWDEWRAAAAEKYEIYKAKREEAGLSKKEEKDEEKEDEEEGEEEEEE